MNDKLNKDKKCPNECKSNVSMNMKVTLYDL